MLKEKGMDYAEIEPDAGSIMSSSTIGSELGYKSEILLRGGYNIPLKGHECVVGGSEEESFTLESFENLIRLAYAKRKTFIIARVTTADPLDAMKIYHSYYAAHHINKVLFRTQPELGLLHRMKSKNPLNNMAIVGDVDYFIVTPASVDRTMKQLYFDIKKEESKKKAEKRLSKHRRVLSDPNISISQLIHKASAQLHSCHESLLGYPKQYQNIKVSYIAEFFASDDDYLMRTEIREYFKVNSLNPDDYLLFTLYTHDDNFHRAGADLDAFPQAEQLRNHHTPASCSNLFGCINTRPTPSLTNRYTGFLTSRGLALFFVVYICGAVATLKFLVPMSYIYLSGFLFAFVFVLVLVLFAEAGPSR